MPPTTVIANPQISSWKKTCRDLDGSVTPARQIAPIVEMGETSTREDPTLIERAMANGLPPPRFSINEGIVGRKAGITTPDVLLYAEI